MKDTSWELKDYEHELPKGHDRRVAMGNHSFFPFLQRSLPLSWQRLRVKKGRWWWWQIKNSRIWPVTNFSFTSWASHICLCYYLAIQILLLFSVSQVYNGEKDTGILWKVFWYQPLENFQEFIITILLMLLLLSFCGLLYWSNDPLILFCWLYRWSFKAAVKCAIKSSRQLTVLIYKQMQPAINRRLKWSNGRASFYIKSYNLSLLSPQLSAPLHAPRHGAADGEAASASVAVHPLLLQTLNLCL